MISVKRHESLFVTGAIGVGIDLSWMSLESEGDSMKSHDILPEPHAANQKVDEYKDYIEEDRLTCSSNYPTVSLGSGQGGRHNSVEEE